MKRASESAEALLFLAHRLPYPPSKGDKVRSWHFFRHLAKGYRVYLGTFIDDPTDWEHVAMLERLCGGLHVEAMVPWARRARSLPALLNGEALSLPYFRSKTLHQWVEETVRREGITRAFVFSSPMAQYVLGMPQLRSVVDFVDMDSAKWGDYATRRGWPASELYAREARCLLAYERAVAAHAEASLFVTEEEVRRFRREAPDLEDRTVAIRNGVDSEYFSPEHEFRSPFASGERPIVFTGAMDYWPNVDAVAWFAREVLPEIRAREPRARFYVVGMNPERAVRALANDGATTVTGRVDDVRPYLQHARVVVAPLRVARGIQNKILEAMAMAKPVVATASAAAALSAKGDEIEVASDARYFAAKVLALLDPEFGEALGRRARERMLKDYAWPTSLAQLDALLEQDGAPAAASAKLVSG